MSYSGAESSMEDGNHRRINGGATNRHRRNGYHNGGDEDGCRDPEAWNAFAESFSQVQTVLDRNRDLIQQANDNHQSRLPDNMGKNVAIINELNGNISKVASIYSDLSANFTDKVKHHRKGCGGSGK